MSVISAALRELVAAGMTGEQLVAAVERIEAACETRRPVDEAAERRRAWDRERKVALRDGGWEANRSIVIQRDGDHCRYCGSLAYPISVDHVIPLSRGGSSDPDNLAVACLNCNIKKGPRTPEECGMVLS